MGTNPITAFLRMCTLGLCLLLNLALGPACAQIPTSLVGIDHIPLAVRNIERASADFKQLGFAIKPGRPHRNGIRNQHIKFPDGSGLELISASTGTDELGAFYLTHLQQGNGPAYLALHARDMAGLRAALAAAGIDFNQQGGLVTFNDPGLTWVFVVADNRSPTDRPEHFAHRNGAAAMGEVWIALGDTVPLSRLLAALGARPGRSARRAPEPTDAESFELSNGRILVVAAHHQLVPGRPVIGAVMSVRRRGGCVPPTRVHGMWLEFCGDP